MSFFRFMFGLPMAALVTAVLFLAMFAMIQQPFEAGEPGADRDWQITVKSRPEEPKGLPERMPDPVAPKPPVISTPNKGDNPGGDFVVPAPKKGDFETDLTVGGVGAGPTIRVAPAYPEACRSRGVEGVVIVEFDVTARGDVTNVRVIASPNSCFDRTVKRAVQRWKYSPDTSSGEARARRGVREVFSFQLTE